MNSHEKVCKISYQKESPAGNMLFNDSLLVYYYGSIEVRVCTFNMIFLLFFRVCHVLSSNKMYL